MTGKKKWIAGAVVVTLLAGGAWMFTRQSDASADAAMLDMQQTAVVEKMDVASNVYASGNVQITESRKLKPEGKGFVTAMHVGVGDKVEKGQLLAEIDVSELNKSLERKNINLEIQKESLNQILLEGESAQKSTLKKALLDFERAKDKLAADKALKQAGSISETTYQAAVDSFEKEKLNLASAQRAVENSNFSSRVKTQKLNIRLIEIEIEDIQQKIEKRRIVSPFEGVVTEINFKKNELYNETTHLLKVQNMNSREIKSLISEAEINKLQVGQKVLVTANSIKGEQKEGTIESISPSTTKKEGKKQAYTEIRVSLHDPENRLRDGFMVNLKIETKTAVNVHAVSFEAVSRSLDGSASVTKMKADGTTEKIPVTLGVEGDVYVELISDKIQEGDELIIESLDLAPSTDSVMDML